MRSHGVGQLKHTNQRLNGGGRDPMLLFVIYLDLIWLLYFMGMSPKLDYESCMILDWAMT